MVELKWWNIHGNSALIFEECLIIMFYLYLQSLNNSELVYQYYSQQFSHYSSYVTKWNQLRKSQVFWEIQEKKISIFNCYPDYPYRIIMFIRIIILYLLVYKCICFFDLMDSSTCRNSINSAQLCAYTEKKERKCFWENTGTLNCAQNTNGI